MKLDFVITPDTIVNFLGVVATVISVIFGVREIVKSTKKYELTEEYRRELFGWYQETVRIMIDLIHMAEHPERPCDERRKAELLSGLSAQIETGRFYFPNVIKGDGFGAKKPEAYRGYRQAVLTFLKRFYEITSGDNAAYQVSFLWELERSFTSYLFIAINPRERIKQYSKYTAITIPEGQSIEDFLRATSHPDQAG